MKKKLFSSFSFFVSCLFLAGCASTGKLNTSSADIKAIESKDTLDLPEACKEHSFFIGGIEDGGAEEANEAIANKIESLVPDGKGKIFLARKNVLLYLKAVHGVFFSPSRSRYDNFLILKDGGNLFYIVFDNDIYSLYSFALDIDQEKVQEYESLVVSYGNIGSSIESNERRISLYNSPTIEKTRQVPYTAYRRVKKSRSVTKYRTVKTSSGSYQEPYTAQESYYESEPYTAYRSETYNSLNPDYNPARAAALEEENDKLRIRRFKIQNDMERCAFFTLELIAE